MLTAVTGINWGDEGKGRVIDLLAEHADVVARYQGGNNAGHTVVTEQGKFILNLLPSGILHPDVVCVLGAGMVIDLDHLAGEMDAIEERARYDLNMVRPGEVLFRIQRPQKSIPGNAIPADIINDPLYRPAPVLPPENAGEKAAKPKNSELSQ